MDEAWIGSSHWDLKINSLTVATHPHDCRCTPRTAVHCLSGRRLSVLKLVGSILVQTPQPIGSMYGIYGNIWGILMANVTIYSSTMDPMGKEDPETTRYVPPKTCHHLPDGCPILWCIFSSAGSS